MASLEIIIVSWNSGVQLRQCLGSVAGARREGFDLDRVVVVDNGSSDGSTDELVFPELPVVLIRNRGNRGFAAACNQAAKDSGADYLLFLNPDTTLTPESLSTAIGFMERRENAKVRVCGIQLVDEEGGVTRSCSRFPKPSHFYAHILGLNRVFPKLFHNNFLSDWDHSETKQVDVVTGAFLLVRRAIFEAVGGFDERFFVYLEDVDFLHAVREGGWQCFYLAGAQAYHKGGGCSEQAKAMRLFYSMESRILYSFKHFGWVAATGVLIGTVLIEPFSRLAWAGWRQSGGEMLDTLRGCAMVWGRLPGLIVGKRERQRDGPASSIFSRRSC